VRTALPLKRVESVLRIAGHVRSLVQNAAVTIQAELARIAATGRTFVDSTSGSTLTNDAKLAAIRTAQWGELWDHVTKSTRESAAELDYAQQNASFDVVLSTLTRTFEETLTREFEVITNDTKKVSLRQQIPKYRTHGFQANTREAEDALRAQLSSRLRKAVGVATKAVADLVYSNVQQFGRELAKQFTEEFGLDVSDTFDATKLVPLHQVEHQMYALSGRVTEPMTVIMVWSWFSEQRDKAISFLRDIHKEAADSFQVHRFRPTNPPAVGAAGANHNTRRGGRGDGGLGGFVNGIAPIAAGAVGGPVAGVVARVVVPAVVGGGGDDDDDEEYT
jgi:hypothetical protein